MFERTIASHMDEGVALTAKDTKDEVKCGLRRPLNFQNSIYRAWSPLQLPRRKADQSNRFNSFNYQTGKNEEFFLWSPKSATPQIPKLFYHLLLHFLPFLDRTIIMTRSVLLTNDVWVTSDLSLLVPRIRPFLHPPQSKSCLVIAIMIIIVNTSITNHRVIIKYPLHDDSIKE